MSESDNKKENKWKKKVIVNKGGSGAIYGLGIIGAAIYYLQHASSFLIGVIGIVKAIFWPAVIIYYVFDKLRL